MILAHISNSLRETFPTRAPEWALGAVLYLWGMVLTFNTDLFTTQQSFHVLAQMMPQSTWAILCLGVGGCRLVMLVINGVWRRSPHLRAFAAFVACFFWFWISLGILQAGTFGTGLAVYPILFLLDAYNVIRAARDAGSSDRIHTGARHGTDS